METVEGILTNLGPSSPSGAVTIYSALQIGQRTLAKIRVFHDLSGPLMEALNSRQPVKLYIKHKIVCAITLANGVTSRSQMLGDVQLFVVMGAAGLLGLITLPFLGMGLFFFYLGYEYFWKIYDAKQAAKRIPVSVGP